MTEEFKPKHTWVEKIAKARHLFMNQTAVAPNEILIGKEALLKLIQEEGFKFMDMQIFISDTLGEEFQVRRAHGTSKLVIPKL